ncbi:hypothetical protein [Salinarimonas sp.]|uniref:hypothetical protein n=1 Tax=Salinarimonas sp. TaxID=2766526 RepID=UPI0032D93F6E
MIVARHRERDLCFVEAYDAGVGVPLIRHPDGAWELAAVDPEELWDDYMDVGNSSERSALLDEAKRAWQVFRASVGEVELDILTVSQIRDRISLGCGLISRQAKSGSRRA